MLSHDSSRRGAAIIASLGAIAAAAACSSSGNGPSNLAKLTVAKCVAAGKAPPGPADSHCHGRPAQATSEAACHPDATASDRGCPYGVTVYGEETDDDDCKYHVTWSSSPICEGSATSGVTFTVVATILGSGAALAGAGTVAEVFTTSSPNDAGCDDQSTHPGPNTGVVLAEGPPGTYVGPIVFDQSGQWTVRFHFHEECADVLPDSPHGHAAFHLTVP